MSSAAEQSEANAEDRFVIVSYTVVDAGLYSISNSDMDLAGVWVSPTLTYMLCGKWTACHLCSWLVFGRSDPGLLARHGHKLIARV
jgi:hypothetical protein